MIGALVIATVLMGTACLWRSAWATYSLARDLRYWRASGQNGAVCEALQSLIYQARVRLAGAVVFTSESVFWLVGPSPDGWPWRAMTARVVILVAVGLLWSVLGRQRHERDTLRVIDAAQRTVRPS